MFIEEAVDRELSRVRMSAVDRGLVQELCYGTVRWQVTLDWLIERRTPRHRPPPPVQLLARLGLYQLFWLDRVPDHAAVNETVEAARTFDLAGQSGFLNALLRGYTREADATRQLLLDLRTGDPALGWSHPRWLVDRWAGRLSPAELQTFLSWNNTPAVDYARVNAIKAHTGRLIEAWRNEGVDYDFSRWDWVPENLMFRLRRHPPFERLESFGHGWYYIQDPSTVLSVALLEPRPGERLLDLCAAPGGKTTLIAQWLDNDGVIVATEPDARRRRRLQENCDRLGADVQVGIATDPEAAGPFDAVLVDAPCSNTGVLRRRLEARWRLQPAELIRSQQQQIELLADAARRLRPGGRLVYSTCSVEPEENADVVKAFLAGHPGYRLTRSRQLDPARDGVDGAYVACLAAP